MFGSFTWLSPLAAASFVASLAFCFSFQPAIAQQSAESQGKFALPNSPESWINAPPLSLDNLKGKGVVLWFFEEGCPRCREKWPSLMETAASYKDRPVLFIGVNSGTPRDELEQYLAEVKCTWPVICDPRRTFEQACDVGEISLMNIMQCKIITSEGELKPGNAGDVSGTAERALSNAKWSVEPDKVPAALEDIRTAVEFGMYPAALARLKGAVKKADTKEGAQYLTNFIKEKAKESADEATALFDAGEDWKAYKAILAIQEKFSGLPIPEKLAAAKKSLASSDAVKKQIKARAQLENAAKAAQAGTPASLKKAKAIVDKLIEDFGDTEAGEQAKQLLQKTPPTKAGS
jgi:thiol-disulfide isomerase/thioredoxin